MKEEILLKQKFGNNMPFMVPEGYFDSLEENLMQNIPEAKASQKPLKRSIFMRPLRWVACFAAVLLVSGAIYLMVLRINLILIRMTTFLRIFHHRHIRIIC